MVGTPIGNLEDISARATRTLGEVDVIFAEDTRKTRALLSHLGITKKPLHRYSEETQGRSTAMVLGQLEAGNDVALVADAGMPTISDPGNSLVAAALDAGFEVTVIPGPTAESAAVALSGVVEGAYLFAGFLKLKKSNLVNLIAGARTAEAAIIGYVAPHDILRAVLLLQELLGNEVQVVVVRELTKIYEERLSGTLEELASTKRIVEPKGEYVVIIPRLSLGIDAIQNDIVVRILNVALDTARSRTERAKAIASFTGVSKSNVYEALG